MIGIYINDSSAPYTEMILNGLKTVETRNRNTLGRYLGERVGIIKTGKGKPILVGYATIESIYQWYTEEAFFRDSWMHRVYDGPYAEWKGNKYGYGLTDVERCDPRYVNAVKRYGRVACEF